MSTFLQLINRARERCGVSGSDLTVVTGLSGQSLWFKNAVIEAWEEIQELHADWYWMRGSYSFTTTADDGSYTSAQAGIASRFSYWDRTYCTVYLTSLGTSDQTELKWLDYETFRSEYLTGTQNSSRPTHYTIGLSNELLVGPAPEDTTYTIAGQYWKAPQTLADAADVPELPEKQRIIVARTMMKYGIRYSAAEMIAEGESQFNEILADLETRYLPAIHWPAPLI